MKSEPKSIVLLIVGLLGTLTIGMSIQENTKPQKSVNKSTEVAAAVKEDKTKLEQKNEKEVIEDTKKEEKVEEKTTEVAMATEEKVQAPVDPIVYDGLTMTELANKLDRSLNSTIAGRGYTFASESLALGIDPYLAVAIVLHETGCKWDCSYLVRACNNVGGMKGSPGCNGGSYAAFPTLDDGIKSYLGNLYRNYYAYGLTTPETIGPKYAASTTWPSKINYYIESIRAN